LAFPEEWRVVVVLPPWGRGRHGADEGAAFRALHARPAGPEATDRLCRLALLGMLPALAERDAEAFGEALFEFNALTGRVCAPVQGGTYADARVEELVAYCRRQGVRGVGQSSWGPAVFAVAADATRADHLAGRLCAHFGMGREDVRCTAACNRGAV